MSDASISEPTTATHRRVTVLGAAGPVGRAVTAALLETGAHVNAVLREPGRHKLAHHPRLRIVQGDVHRFGTLTNHLRNTDTVVLSVAPFTAPERPAAGFDRDCYARAVRGIDTYWQAPRRRLVSIGLTATLRLSDGAAVMDDATLFPPALTPLADAHARQLPALTTTTIDWAILTPPAGLGTEPQPAAATRYRLAAEPLTREEATTPLAHSVYARAVADESTRPTVHTARVAVLPQG